MELGNINENLIEEDTCIICFEPIITSLEKKNTNITCKCNVQYHNTCLEQWFSRSPTCPICHTFIRHKYKCSHQYMDFYLFFFIGSQRDKKFKYTMRYIV